MNRLVHAAITRTRTTMALMLMVLLAGVIARLNIPIESDPNIEVPVYVITIVHEGISPEDAERLIIMPMETELRAVEGVKETRATAAEGSATIVVEFDAEADASVSLTDVREAVDRARPEIPSTSEEPIVSEVSASDFAVIAINFSAADVSERTLLRLAQKLRDELEAIPEVLETQVTGNREELLEAVVDPTLLETYGLSLSEVANAILRNNRLIPAGSIDDGSGRFSVKVPSVIENASDVFDIPVKSVDGTVVTLRDVAQIRRTFKDRQSYSRVNGVAAISLQVNKRSTANLIDTVAKVRAVVERERQAFPPAVRLTYTQDQAPFAKQQVTELEGNIVTALALVMTLVVAALGLRSAIIVGMAIPVSFLFALTLLWLQGFTFNFMVMFGMLLGLGMLIDGAIVVTEYADRRMAEGMHRKDAYSAAASRMFWPVVASTGTTLAAFLPLLFWPGVSGKFMFFLPATVFTVLIGSLLYALVFGPALGGIFGKVSAQTKGQRAALRTLERGDPTTLRSLTGLYARFLRVAARWPFLTLALTVAVLYTSFWSYGKYGSGMEFFTDTDPQFAIVSVRARGNLSARERSDLVAEVEDLVLDVAGIRYLDSSTVRSTGGGFRGSGAPDTIGRLFLQLHEQSQRGRTGRELLEDVRARVADIPGIFVDVQEMEKGPPVGKPVQLQFSSSRWELVPPIMDRIRHHMENGMTGLRELEDTLPTPGIEWAFTVDRAQAAVYGADVTTVGQAVQLVTNGIKVAEYRPDDAEDEVDIRVRFPAAHRGLDALKTLVIPTPSGPVPATSFVTFGPEPKVDTIERIDGKRVAFIRANVGADVLADAKVKELAAWIEAQGFDPAVKVEFRGANEEQASAMAFVGTAFMMSLLLMFVLLVTQFNSFYQATLILFAVVMSTAGVLIGLLITGDPFSAILTGVGVVALAGIVVNNNIVLIDTFNELRADNPDEPIIETVVRTGAQRLRPVLLTTVTTVFGLLPMANHLSVDLINREVIAGGQVSAFWVPLARSIVFGLSFATVLTLISTPALLVIPSRLKSLVERLRRRQPAAQSDELGVGLQPLDPAR